MPMPSPYFERGDVAITVFPAIALVTLDEESDEKKAMRLSCVEGARAEKNPRKLSRQWLLPAQFTNVLFDLLQKTSNNECSCAENAGSASVHGQSFTSSNL